jgi:hypothetical protein
MKRYVALIALFLYSCGISAFDHPRCGARAVSLSGALVALTDPWSTFHNQAGLARFESVVGAVFYSSRFGLKELAHTAGTVVLPVKPGTFGLSYSQFGTGSCKDLKAGLAYARNLSNHITAGIQLDYLACLLPENQHAATCFTFEGGILLKASESITLGVHLFNPLHQNYKGYSSKIKVPVIVRSGAGLTLSKWLLIAFEMEKSSGIPLLFKTGFEVRSPQNLTFRLGISGEPFSYTAGFGYQIGKIISNIGFFYHGNLGFTPAVSLQYHLK